MMGLNPGDLSFLKGLTEVKKQLSPLGPRLSLGCCSEETCLILLESFKAIWCWRGSQ